MVKKHGELVYFLKTSPINRSKVANVFKHVPDEPRQTGGLRSLRQASTQLTLYLTMVEYRPQLEHPMNPFVQSFNRSNFGKGRPWQNSNINFLRRDR
jgi:hypothetical protein